MFIYPAIDLREGKCVRLYKGDFATSTIYHDNPHTMLQQFIDAGSQYLHIVDLDGAKARQVQQSELIAQLVQAHPQLHIQVGGGVRSKQDLHSLFAAGVKRVVIGSLAIEQPQVVQQWFTEFGCEKIVLALDCHIDQHGVAKVATSGWQHTSETTLYQVLDYYPQAQYLLCTDISRDGTLTGVNLELYQQINHYAPHLKIIASGGVADLSDLQKLKQLNIYGVIVGKALYEQKFNLSEALQLVK
jgi:phosphoribosylformimino-5-aminoimidazole carboxamide ribotide isomerase